MSRSAIRGAISLRQYLTALPFIGVTATAFNDLYRNVIADYLSEVLTTSFQDELISIVTTPVPIVLTFLLLFFLLTRALFETSPNPSKASKADTALVHGLTLILLGGIAYMVFGSPARMIFGG